MSRLALWAPGSAMVLSVVAMILGLPCGSPRAQTLPAPGGQDLTLPPDLRNDVSSVKQAHKPDPHPRAARSPIPAEVRNVAKRHAPAPDPHPVDLGVTLRGGSGTPRVYGATGTSEAIQESGSAFGAAMRFGF